MIDPSGSVSLAADAASADAVGLVQKEVAVTERGLRILIDGNDDGLDVLVTPPLTNRIAVGIDDQDRAEKALKGISGKRLTYRWPDSIQPPF
jgi:hypothetical protein